jgi:hypothetical protein
MAPSGFPRRVPDLFGSQPPRLEIRTSGPAPRPRMASEMSAVMCRIIRAADGKGRICLPRLANATVVTEAASANECELQLASRPLLVRMQDWAAHRIFRHDVSRWPSDRHSSQPTGRQTGLPSEQLRHRLRPRAVQAQARPGSGGATAGGD